MVTGFIQKELSTSIDADTLDLTNKHANLVIVDSKINRPIENAKIQTLIVMPNAEIDKRDFKKCDIKDIINLSDYTEKDLKKAGLKCQHSFDLGDNDKYILKVYQAEQKLQSKTKPFNKCQTEKDFKKNAEFKKITNEFFKANTADKLAKNFRTGRDISDEIDKLVKFGKTEVCLRPNTPEIIEECERLKSDKIVNNLFQNSFDNRFCGKSEFVEMALNPKYQQMRLGIHSNQDICTVLDIINQGCLLQTPEDSLQPNSIDACLIGNNDTVYSTTYFAGLSNYQECLPPGASFVFPLNDYEYEMLSTVGNSEYTIGARYMDPRNSCIVCTNENLDIIADAVRNSPVPNMPVMTYDNFARNLDMQLEAYIDSQRPSIDEMLEAAELKDYAEERNQQDLIKSDSELCM